MTFANPVLLFTSIGVLSAGTYAFRFAGPALRSRITFPPRVARFLEVSSVVLLASLVAIYGLTEGAAFAGYARPAGVVVAGVLAWRRAPFILVIAAAAAVTVGLRLVGVP
ncbi:AzlD domain-containing protein [Actinokineospora bangkokensis]|uniref:Branched-chain amino acid transporter n=1 Tax=Actinokineospora bangkokensis TaxID=1193682 RepID=A0A1Q9LS46_9PSEU|nr:AzlD domain-containing protein [Actinokineospora bangkokensis]OLR94852.1 branched-chain amino acid transporter [Actinokineospora bangkokensis]